MIVVPWLRIAHQQLGVTEIPGERHNQKILDYHGVTTLKATSDEVFWCSSFICWCFEEAGIRSTRSARARSWLRWGASLSLRYIPLGAVCVFNRGGPHDASVIEASGHVGFFISDEGAERILILGGNQGNAVSYRTYGRKDLLGVRWPKQI